MESTENLDVFDKKLLTELQENARLSYADLGRKIGLSPSATAERLHRLEDSGVIQGYTVTLKREAVGFSLLAYVRMTCEGGRYQSFLKFIKTMEAVRECHHVTGGDAFFLEVTVSSIQELETVIEKLLPYGIPTTSIVLSSPVVRRAFSIL